MNTTDTTEAQLLAELDANRKDEACWLVLADYWAERGDYRGEFLRWLRAWDCWGPNRPIQDDAGYWFAGNSFRRPVAEGRETVLWSTPVALTSARPYSGMSWLDALLNAADGYAKDRTGGWEPEWPEGYE